MNPSNNFLRFILDLYLGRRGYRVSLITYGVGFWIFAIGIMLMLTTRDTQSILILAMRGFLINFGLIILVLMTYPVIYCAFQNTDTTRPKSQFRRILEPTVVAALAPIYLMLLVSTFIRSFAGPVLLGIN
ncbi:MAG: hypothetical protein CL566_00495 [Alphaproteobacteria bacterium]|nr:hypothetical protein [Alphaproteobacteria bacterium]|tara:strand:- start:1418 stop:1807 length:390 start_codon:yes stop_codon:yes gene_type:complete